MELHQSQHTLDETAEFKFQRAKHAGYGHDSNYCVDYSVSYLDCWS